MLITKPHSKHVLIPSEQGNVSNRMRIASDPTVVVLIPSEQGNVSNSTLSAQDVRKLS